MTRVKHINIKNGSLVTHIGTFEFDAEGICDVPPDTAKDLVARYAGRFEIMSDEAVQVVETDRKEDSTLITETGELVKGVIEKVVSKSKPKKAKNHRR